MSEHRFYVKELRPDHHDRLQWVLASSALGLRHSRHVSEMEQAHPECIKAIKLDSIGIVGCVVYERRGDSCYPIFVMAGSYQHMGVELRYAYQRDVLNVVTKDIRTNLPVRDDANIISLIGRSSEVPELAAA